MRHLIFALASLALSPLVVVAGAQRVPGRDLMQFSVAALDRPAALGTELADGLGNPAALTQLGSARLRVGAAALQTPSAQSVGAQLLAAAYSLTDRIVVGISAARWTVDDIASTTTSPDASNVDVDYNTALLSLTAARRNSRHVSVGFSVRARTGVVGDRRDTGLAVDGGILADSLWREARIGVSTFLWRPAERHL
jgi:hypothetical protein